MRDNIIIVVLLAAIGSIIGWGAHQSRLRQQVIEKKKMESKDVQVGVKKDTEAKTGKLAEEVPNLTREALDLEEQNQQTEGSIKQEQTRHASLVPQLEELRRGVEAAEEEEALLTTALENLKAEVENARVTRDQKKSLKATLREVEVTRCQEVLATGSPDKVRQFAYMYSKSAYAPAMLYALGELLQERGAFEAATAVYQELIGKYPSCSTYVEKAKGSLALSRAKKPGAGFSSVDLEPCEPKGAAE